MYHKKSEKGQALVLIALAAVGLFAFTALAIDGGMVFSDRRHAQNAADTAALAAALAKIRTPDYPPNPPDAPRLAAEAAGLERAASNGYDNNGTTNVVEVHMPPISGQYLGNDDYIQVIITSHVRMMFARIVGRQFVTNVAEAVTRAHSGSSDTSSGLAAISALAPSGTGVFLNGNVSLDVINSGVFSNSNSGCPGGSIVAVGNGDLNVDDDYGYTVGRNGTDGDFCQNGAINLNGDLLSWTDQMPYPPTYLKKPPVPSIDCLSDGSITGNTINPGRFTSQFTIPSTYGNYTFATGNYCFENGANINGNYSLTAQPDVKFRINGGGFTINGNTALVCEGNLLIWNETGPGVDILGNSTTTCGDVSGPDPIHNITFYMSSGTVYFSGTSANTLSAPTSGVYKGLLIYLAEGNRTPLRIEGNSNQHFTGSIIGVSSDITVAGNNTSFAVNTQFVGYTFTVSGNITFAVNYNPDQQYLPPEGPAIELIE